MQKPSGRMFWLVPIVSKRINLQKGLLAEAQRKATG
jgi:hypothetical protein